MDPLKCSMDIVGLVESGDPTPCFLYLGNELYDVSVVSGIKNDYPLHISCKFCGTRNQIVTLPDLTHSACDSLVNNLYSYMYMFMRIHCLTMYCRVP